jgi:DNA polymerase-1
MLEAYRAGSDLHALTSVRLGITRQEAKPVNFGIVYGEGAAALAASLGIPFARAAYFIKSWFDAFPSVKEKQEHLQKELHYNGFVSDFFGRQYRYPKSAPHKCINAVIQGGCATILKCAMVSVAEMIRHMPGVRILECIHDELCIEVPEARYSKNFVRQVCRRMEDVPEFTQHGVELIVEPSVAYDNWANKQAIENWR